MFFMIDYTVFFSDTDSMFFCYILQFEDVVRVEYNYDIEHTKLYLKLHTIEYNFTTIFSILTKKFMQAIDVFLIAIHSLYKL